jgi:hypothetical protein
MSWHGTVYTRGIVLRDKIVVGITEYRGAKYHYIETRSGTSPLPKYLQPIVDRAMREEAHEREKKNKTRYKLVHRVNGKAR